MLKEAIILAGGLGTRLQGVIKDLPKPMADINGLPFIDYLVRYLQQYGIHKIILSIGYKADVIQKYFEGRVLCSIEDKPLGTGGGIKKALQKTVEKDVVVLNGDTFFDIDLEEFYRHHVEKGAELSIALRNSDNCDRYDSVALNKDGRIVEIRPRKTVSSGLINGGIYILGRHLLDNEPEAFSLETDFLMRHYKELKVFGCVFDGYFIDIGTPEDYERAKAAPSLTKLLHWQPKDSNNT